MKISMAWGLSSGRSIVDVWLSTEFWLVQAALKKVEKYERTALWQEKVWRSGDPGAPTTMVMIWGVQRSLYAKLISVCFFVKGRNKHA